jgi:tetratricopeptide (TPR) repeat protein
MTKKKLKTRPAPQDGNSDADARKERVKQLVGEGARLLAAKRPGEAVTVLSQAQDLDPENVAIAINLGGAYVLQGKHNRAIPLLEQASRLDPNSVMVWTNLAAAYLGKLPFASAEMQDRAIAAYEQALALDPKAPHVHYNLGLIYLERNDPLRASAHFYGALETDPSDRDAQLWLDKIRRGDVDDTANSATTGD